MVPNGECRNAAWLKKGFYQLLDLSPSIPPADLQLSEEVTFFFRGGMGSNCWALVKALLIQHNASAKPQRTLHVLHSQLVRSNSNNHLVFRCLFMSVAFICRQRSLCFLSGLFRDASESPAAQVEDNYPSTPSLVLPQ